MGEAKPTPGPCYADGQVVHSDAVTCIAKFGDAYPDRRWSGTDFATEAHKEANAELFAEAINVLTDTSLTPSQLVEQRDELLAALLTVDLRLRKCFGQCVYADEAYDSFYQEIVAAAISKALPNTAEPQGVAYADPEDPDTTSRDQYKRMFHAACADLGAINEALGLDPDDGGAEPILEAIGALRASNGQAPYGAAQMVPLSVARDAVDHVALHNSSTREREAIAMLRAAVVDTRPAATAQAAPAAAKEPSP